VSRTRLQIRQLVVQQFPLPFISGITTTSDAATITDLPVFGKYADNHFIGAHVYHADATVTDRVVTDSVQSTGVLTYIPSDDGGKDNTDAYEILPYSATAIHQAIDDSLIEAYDHGWLSERVLLSHWVTGSPIYNSTFDHWTSTTQPAGWDTAPTMTQESWLGTKSTQPGRLGVSFTGGGTLAQAAEYRRFMIDLRGHGITVRAALYSEAATAIRVQITHDSTTTSSSYHSGGGQWEILSATVDIPSTADEIYCRIHVNASSVNIASAVWVEGGPTIREYPWASDLAPDGPDAIYAVPTNVDELDFTAAMHHGGRFTALDKWQVYTFDEDPVIGTRREGSLIFHGTVPRAGYRLWMPTRKPFTLPTSDTSRVAFSEEDSLLLAKMAALKLVEANMYGLNTAEQTRLVQFAGRLQSHIQDLSQGRGEQGAARPLGIGW